MRTIELQSTSGICRIFTGESILNAVQYLKGRRVVIIADENVIKLHGNKFPDARIISVLQGEDSKRIENVIRIYKELLEAEVDRSWFILGIGGGVVTDLAGYVASTYLRGLPFGFISTTLLGQVDAAIGGKNGVNLDGYKNIVGVIRQPEFVICDISLLDTLDKREFITGWAEVIKYAAIKDRNFFSYLEDNLERGMLMNAEVMNEIVYQSALWKVEIVEKDEFETGDRKLLNFGHTFAHGFEKIFKIPHGEAVSMGMAIAARVSVNFGMLSHDAAEKLIALLIRTGLPVSIDFDPDELTQVMRKDKKRAGDTIQLILLEKLGKAVVTPVPVNNLKEILHDLR